MCYRNYYKSKDQCDYSKDITKLQKLGDLVYTSIMGMACGFLFYFAFALMVFQMKNPKANELTVFTHLYDIMTFATVEDLQE
jgi:hypothetical protein